MISQRTWLALSIALLAALGAHASGKPWWVDYPFLGDAFDVGTLTFVMVRCLLQFDDWGRRP
jgi:hypothetical protein